MTYNVVVTATLEHGDEVWHTVADDGQVCDEIARIAELLGVDTVGVHITDTYGNEVFNSNVRCTL
jgi:hypothetical protein